MKLPSLTINFGYGGRFIDRVNPWSEAFGPFWGGCYQSVMNDEALWLSASMSDDQWKHAAETLRDRHGPRFCTVQIVGHGTRCSAGPFGIADVDRGPRREFLEELAGKRPQKVFLRTCHSGQSVELLQGLANLLHAPVYAGDGVYAVINFGNWWVAFPDNGGVKRLAAPRV